MASSNRHWPSMFKSKPTNSTNQCHFSSSSPHTPGGDRERSTPEPKPRWNPRPEQIGILEAIFNSGMVNPPREEIRKIRARLQEYGQVGDANVFYWFQNRKSRSKNKQRHLQKPPPPRVHTPANSSLSSSTLMNSPTSSVNQPPFYQCASLSNQLLNEASSFLHSSSISQGRISYLSSSCVSDQIQESCVGNCSNVLVGDDHQFMLLNDHGPLRKDNDDQVIDKLSPQQIITPTEPIHVPHILQDLGGRPPQKMRVFINDVCYEVAAAAPFNVREAFGDDAVLIQLPSGMPLLTNQSGLTYQPLQNGAFYYLINPSFGLGKP